jgi:hypothetical protein
MIKQNLGDVLTLISMHPTAARTATGNGAVAPDLRDIEGEIAILLDSAAGTGTTPTLDVKIQDSADGSTGWTDIAGATFTQVVAVASQQKLVLNKDAVRRYIRIVHTIAGTTPSFTFSVNAVGVSKYPA